MFPSDDFEMLKKLFEPFISVRMSYNINLAKAAGKLEGSNQLMTAQFKY